MQKWISVTCYFVTMGLIMACGPKNVVVLVPDPDGSVGQIRVSNAAGSVDIDQANQSTVIRDQNKAPGRPVQLDPADIQELFGNVLTNQPPPPVHFLLYFKSDSTELLPASTDQIPDIVAEIQKRTPTQISVIGHSDTMGNKDYNLDLSMRRAMAVKQLLVDEGIADTFIDVSSHGEENPVVKTADGVANAKNRRVEVVVR